MPLHTEIEFERDICQHLAAHGWLYAEPGNVRLKKKSIRRRILKKISGV